MSSFLSAFITLTKLNGLRTKIGVCSVDRLEEIKGGTRIIQEHTFVDVSDKIDAVEEAVSVRQMELSVFDQAVQEHDEGEDWKHGPPEEV